MRGLPEPVFVPHDGAAITHEMVAAWEALTGKTLYPAQIEQQLINQIALRENLTRIAANEAAKQNLLRYAAGPVLDHLGEFWDCPRLQDQAAMARFQFTLEAPQVTGVLVPRGTRIEPPSGKVQFTTDQDMVIAAGALTITVTGHCTIAGTDGNDWAPGALAVLRDVLSAPMTVSNITASSGGMLVETDEPYRRRIALAARAISTAGSQESYIFHALSVHQMISDATATMPQPGHVHVVVLTQNGPPDANLLPLVQERLTGWKVRPLTDFVTVFGAAPVDYAITAQLLISRSADASAVLAAAEASIRAYRDDRALRLGRDIEPSAIIAALSVPGVVRVTLTAPLAPLELTAAQWPRCTGITLTLAGVSDE